MKHCIRKNCFETNSSSMHSIVVTKDDNFITASTMIEEYMVETRFSNKRDDNGKRIHERVIDLTMESFEFEREPFRVLVSLKDKLRYVIASLAKDPFLYDYSDEVYEKDLSIVKRIEDIIREVYPGFDRLILPRYVGSYYFNDKVRPRYKCVDDNGKAIHPGLVKYDFLNGKDSAPTGVYYEKDGKKIMLHETDEISDAVEFGHIDHQSAGLLQDFLRKNSVSLKDFLFNQKYYVVVDGDEYCIFDMYKKANIIRTDNVVQEFGIDDITNDRFSIEEELEIINMDDKQIDELLLK